MKVLPPQLRDQLVDAHVNVGMAMDHGLPDAPALNRDLSIVMRKLSDAEYDLSSFALSHVGHLSVSPTKPLPATRPTASLEPVSNAIVVGNEWTGSGDTVMRINQQNMTVASIEWNMILSNVLFARIGHGAIDIRLIRRTVTTFSIVTEARPDTPRGDGGLVGFYGEQHLCTANGSRFLFFAAAFQLKTGYDVNTQWELYDMSGRLVTAPEYDQPYHVKSVYWKGWLSTWDDRLDCVSELDQRSVVSFQRTEPIPSQPYVAGWIETASPTSSGDRSAG
jgi:hypothetical protein